MCMLRYVDSTLHCGRFSELEELAKDFTEITYGKSDMPKVNEKAGLAAEIRCDSKGLVIGALIDGEDTNSAVVAYPGSGKTRRIISPYILSCIYAKQHMVVHDPKNELLSFFSRLLKKWGYNIIVLNLRDPDSGDRFNILQEAAALYKSGQHGKALLKVHGIAECLFSDIETEADKFWTEAAVELFMTYFIVATHIYEPEYVTLSTIYRIHIEGQVKKHNTPSIMLFLEEHKDEKCYELGMPIFESASDTRKSIYAIFGNGLMRLVLSESIEDMTTKSTFSLEELIEDENPMAIFIVTADENPKTNGPLVASFVDTIYSSLVDLAQNKYNMRLPQTVHFIMDEFAHIRLNNINSMLTSSRSRNIRWCLALQSLAQLSLNYPKEARIIIGNVQNLVFMSSSDMELVELVSNRCGATIDPYTNETRRLLSPDRLTHLDKASGEALLLLDRHYPYISHFVDISRYPMIQPLDKFQLPQRDRLKVDYEVFSRMAAELMKKKVNALMKEAEPIKDSNFETDDSLSTTDTRKISDKSKKIRRKAIPRDYRRLIDEAIRSNRRREDE